jgi:hypothetical protein
MIAAKHVVTGFVFAASLAMLPASAHATAVPIANPDFASGLTGWSTTQTDGNFPWIAVSGASPTFASTGCTGAACISGTPGQVADLFQDVATTSGNSYTLTFEYDDEDGIPSDLVALFGGTVADNLVSVNTTSLNTYTVSGLIATSNSTKLDFLGRDDDGFDQLTDITLTDNTVTPEPATISLVATGLLCLIGVVRRRIFQCNFRFR